MHEVMELPASEINFWREYYSIYPFPQDREDFRMMVLAELINNIPQGLAYKGRTRKFFNPDWLGEIDWQAIEEQRQIAAEIAYANHLEAMEKLNGNQT